MVYCRVGVAGAWFILNPKTNTNTNNNNVTYVCTVCKCGVLHVGVKQKCYTVYS